MRDVKELRMQWAIDALGKNPELSDDDGLPFDSWETDIIDLVTNLLHLARSKRVPAERVLRMAEMHWEAEK